jgi:hypothetical protein
LTDRSSCCVTAYASEWQAALPVSSTGSYTSWQQVGMHVTGIVLQHIDGQAFDVAWDLSAGTS